MAYQYHLDDLKGYKNRMGSYKTAVELNFIKSFLPKCKLKILDLGGGAGRFAIPISKLGHTITVVDRSQEAIKTVSNYQNVNGICMDVMKFKEDKYDCILAIEIIQYLNSPSVFVNNI